jgi:predicted kinase
MQEDTSFDIGAAVAAAKSTLTMPTPAPGQPVLVMLCGLPGTGKSTLARRLQHRLPAVVVESDRVRQRLFARPGLPACASGPGQGATQAGARPGLPAGAPATPLAPGAGRGSGPGQGATQAGARPTYTAEESRRVHVVCHILIGWCLRHYYHVVYDATNLYEHHRRLAYRLAERNGARLLVVDVTASEEVIRERLAPRRRGDLATYGPDDYSDADWEVYVRMRRRAEPIQYEHITLDTSDGDVERAVEHVLEAVKGR